MAVNGARPDYEMCDAYRHSNQFLCRGCGSIVFNIRIHDAWHERLAAS